MSNEKAKAKVPNPRAWVGTTEIGPHKFKILHSPSLTLRQAETVSLFLVRELFEELVPVPPLGVSEECMRTVVVSELQNRWYAHVKGQVPEHVRRNHEARLAALWEKPAGINEALAIGWPEYHQTQTATGDPGDGRQVVARPPRRKRGGTSIGGVIMDGLRAGRTDDEILEAVREQFPESKTGKNSLAYYKVIARKEGILPKSARAKKA